MNKLAKRLYDGGVGMTINRRLNPKRVPHEVIYQTRKLFRHDDPVVFSIKWSEEALKKKGYSDRNGLKRFFLVYINRLIRKTYLAQKKRFAWIWAMAIWNGDVYLYGERRNIY